MPVADQTERYRRHAALCYEIAASLSGERAVSMIRLGDTYAALAVDAHEGPNAFLPTTKYDVPLCKKCGMPMNFSVGLPRTELMSSLQAFRCEPCHETLIWKGREHAVTRHVGAERAKPRAEQRNRRRYFAASFRREDKEFAPGPTVECPDAETAIQRAALFVVQPKIGGSVAFSRVIDAITGEAEAAVILKRFGELPDGFDIG